MTGRNRVILSAVACVFAGYVNASTLGSLPSPSPSLAYWQLASIGKSQAAEIARSTYGGKVLKVEEVERSGKIVYRVKLLLDGGRIKIVTVDGDSGQIG